MAKYSARDHLDSRGKVENGFLLVTTRRPQVCHLPKFAGQRRGVRAACGKQGAFWLDTENLSKIDRLHGLKSICAGCLRRRDPRQLSDDTIALLQDTIDNLELIEHDPEPTPVDVDGLIAALEKISLLALEANEEYERSCRAKVSRIRDEAERALGRRQ